MARPYCCVAAEFDGIPAAEHLKVCRCQPEPVQAETLFDLPEVKPEPKERL